MVKVTLARHRLIRLCNHELFHGEFIDNVEMKQVNEFPALEGIFVGYLNFVLKQMRLRLLDIRYRYDHDTRE